MAVGASEVQSESRSDIPNSGARTRSVEVTILGQRMVLRSQDDPAHVARVAAYVQEKISALSSRGGHVAPNTLVVLAAINIADEYFRSQRDNQDFKRHVASASRALLRELEGLQQPDER